MNPQNNDTSSQSGLSLPPVVPDTQSASAPVPTPVDGPATPPTTSDPAPAIPTSSVPSVAVSTVPTDDSPMIADDTDLIEKEWVDKAKQLVEQTKNDPFKQNQEINKIKATYIKKRYNKDIQVSNE